MSVEPLANKYPSWSPYSYVLNNPTNAVDPDGKDIIFVIDREAAKNNGHIAVLIGDEKNGWRYVSMNGTGEGSRPWGKSRNPDVGTLIVDVEGNKIMDPLQAVLRANDINPNEEHSYDFYKRLLSTDKEDKNAVDKAVKVASAKTYGIAGPGKSCIDVAQAAFQSLVQDRGLEDPWYKSTPGDSDLIPNNWFDNLEKRVSDANKFTKKELHKIDVIGPEKND